MECPLLPTFSQVSSLSQDITAASFKKRNKMSELLWSHCVSLQITYKFFFWMGEQGGGSLLHPNLLSASTWPKSFLPLSVPFYVPQGTCSHWLFKQHPMPLRCVPFQVFLLLFVTDMPSHVFSANTVLPPLSDAINLEVLSSYMCVLIHACFAMCLCSGGWYLLFQLPDFRKALTGFFTCSLCGQVTAVFPSFKLNQFLAILVLF